MYIYTAGIVHSSSAAAYTSKASAGVKQTTLVPYANSCMCLRKGVHVTTLNATLGDSSSASISIWWLIVFFFSTLLSNSSLVSERRLLSAQCMLQENKT